MGKLLSPQPNSTRRCTAAINVAIPRNRKQLIAQAEQLARADVAALTADQARLKTEAAGLGDKAVGESSSNESTGCDR
jgi:hypothetical protein